MNDWALLRTDLDLCEFLQDFGGIRLSAEVRFQLFKWKAHYLVVIRTSNGLRYYDTKHPELKKTGFDLVLFILSQTEDTQSALLWDRVAKFYQDFLQSDNLRLDKGNDAPLQVVPEDFNHFHTYVEIPNANEGQEKYLTSTALADSVYMNSKGSVLFPLYNYQNEVCGYLVEGEDHGTSIYEESSLRESLWYSNIPDQIEGLFIFSYPWEALAFHRKFELTNVVYIALGQINYDTTRILFQIYKLSKVKKLMLALTDHTKISGYVRDLHFLSFLEKDFSLRVSEKLLNISLKGYHKRSLARFYKDCKQYNEALRHNYLKHHNLIDQHLVNRYSLILSQEGERIHVKVPLETQALQYVVWCYYKNFLKSTVELLKPKSVNWYSEWQTTETSTNSGKEEQWEAYRVAL